MPDSPDRLAAALEDRYTLQRELGRGGMATVYLATDVKHERAVALKVLKPELAAVLATQRAALQLRAELKSLPEAPGRGGLGPRRAWPPRGGRPWIYCCGVRPETSRRPSARRNSAASG